MENNKQDKPKIVTTKNVFIPSEILIKEQSRKYPTEEIQKAKLSHYGLRLYFK
ncbi:hypothetical protein LCGC14_1891320 [marine sediment metagenome]|uniref:Uncharacterized protein n=1 Tax=marine sediment metagenome TaxID=412755 RepID=A0A0F9IXJ9_9ZZZZ